MFLKANNQSLEKTDFISIDEIDKEVHLKGYFFHDEKLYDNKNIQSFFKKNPTNQILESLNGFFNIIIICKKTNEINIINDRVGALGLYYKISEKEIQISDSIKELISSDTAIDEESIIEMLRFRFTSGKYTLYKNIFKLTPAAKIKIKFNPSLQFDYSRYWDYSFKSKNRNLDEAEKDGFNILQSIIKKYEKNLGEKQIGLFLSGGFDSRAMLGLLMKNNNFNKIKTFSYGHNECDDVIIAKHISKIYNLDCEIFSDKEYSENLFNKEKIFQSIEEIGHTSYYMQGLYHQIMSDRLKYIDNIILGDPGFLLGIYFSDFDSSIKDNQSLINYIFKKNRTGLTPKEIKDVMDSDYSENKIIDILSNRMNESFGENKDYKIKYYKWIQENRFRNYILTSQIDMLMKSDKKVLSPLYDIEFIEYLFSLNHEHYKNFRVYYNILGKYIFTEKLKKMADIKYDSRGFYKMDGEDYLPIIKNKKIKSLIKLKNKITGKYQKNDLFPLFMFRKFNKVKFDKKLDNLIDVKSNILNIDKMKNLIYKNRGSKFSLKYKVLIILSAVLTEQYMNNEKKQ